jgi:hypothetical protein
MFTMPVRTNNPPTAADFKHPGSGIKDAYVWLDAAATFQKLTATEYLQPAISGNYKSNTLNPSKKQQKTIDANSELILRLYAQI